MEIKFVGVGGAFDANNINSSAIININSQRLLIDCGHSVYPELVKKDLANKIDAVVLTHFHDDHIGSFSSFAFYCFHVLGKKIKVFLPENEAFREKFFHFVSITTVRYENYMEVATIDKSIMEPVETTNLHSPGMPSFSYFFYEGKEAIVYSGDLGDPDFLFKEIEKRKLDCSSLLIFHDTSFFKNTAHAYYKDLMKWQGKYKIFSFHCPTDEIPPDNTLPLVYNSEYFLN